MKASILAAVLVGLLITPPAVAAGGTGDLGLDGITVDSVTWTPSGVRASGFISCSQDLADVLVDVLVTQTRAFMELDGDTQIGIDCSAAVGTASFTFTIVPLEHGTFLPQDAIVEATAVASTCDRHGCVKDIESWGPETINLGH